MAKKIRVSSAKKNKKAPVPIGGERFAPRPGGNAPAVLAEGLRAQAEGRLDEALSLFARHLRENPAAADAMLYTGMTYYLKKDLPAARSWLEKARAAGVDEGMYFLNLGLVNESEGKYQDALDCQRKAVELLPRQQQAHYNLGLVLLKLNRPDEAAAAFRQAYALAPDDQEILFKLACSLLESGNAAEAYPLFADFVARNPDQARGWATMGVCHAQRKRMDEAAPCFERALELAPDDANICYRYAGFLRDNKQCAAALKYFLRARELDPGSLAYACDLGYCQALCGDVAAASATAEEAIKMVPSSHFPHLLMGYIWIRRNSQKALYHFDKALELNPRAEGEIVGLKALAQHFCGMVRDAETNFQRAIELCPRNPDYYMNYGNTLMVQARIPECLEKLGQTLRLRPDNYYAFSNVLLYSHYIPGATRDDLWQLFQDYDRRYARPLLPENLCFPNPRDPERRLRVGFVSCDFRTHSVAFFVEPLLRSHDRSRFEFFCYSSSATKDQYTGLLQGYVENWRDILPLSDAQTAEMVRRDGIDILVDLGGHTSDNRLLVFAHKPAPVQASWLGFPDTTGLSAIDYRISDPFADPPEYDHMSAEKVVRLPGGFHCYCPFPNAPEIVPLPSAQSGRITFGSFNNYAKTSTEIAALWVMILNRVPGSRLMLKSLGLSDEQVSAGVRERFSRLGLDPERLVISPRTAAIYDHLDMYNQIDIALDTWPYNGTTTTFEALWMGVPIVSLIGATHASRVGASLLTNCGLQDLVCSSPEEYVAKAVGFAEHPEIIRKVRGNMRERLRLSPLLSEPWFTRKFEAALRGMWKEYCGEKDAVNACLRALPPYVPHSVAVSAPEPARAEPPLPAAAAGEDLSAFKVDF